MGSFYTRSFKELQTERSEKIKFELFCRIYLPYCILKDEKSGGYVVLNRNYKPLGFTNEDGKHSVNYEDYPISFNPKKGCKKMNASELGGTFFHAPYPDSDAVFLYNDSTVPVYSAKNMKLYLENIKILAKLKIQYKKQDE